MTPIKFLALAAAAAALLSACAPDDEDTNDAGVKNAELIKGINMPEGLKDCKTFRVWGEHNFHMLVTRCPHSDTSTTGGGKNEPNSIVANDEEEDLEPVPAK